VLIQILRLHKNFSDDGMLPKLLRLNSFCSRRILAASVFKPIQVYNQVRTTTSVKYFGVIKHPVGYEKISDDALFIIASLGDQDARRERLLREIMKVDKISRVEAFPIFRDIVRSNREGLFFFTLPGRLAIGTALLSAGISVPMIFDYNLVLWFNEWYVTADIPEPKDLETWLEVGSFAWNWMEPLLGTVSFVLLCFQFARAQMANLAWRPFTQAFLRYRANKLIETYPQYDYLILQHFSEGDELSKVRIRS
jgi:hypothetical protein